MATKDQIRRLKAQAAGAGKSSSAPVTAAESEAPKKRTSLPQFTKEVRAEARKITWTSWKETWISAVQVLIFVTITSIFFLIVDGSLSFAIQQLLKWASS